MLPKYGGRGQYMRWKKTEARKILENAAESPASCARGVGRIFQFALHDIRATPELKARATLSVGPLRGTYAYIPKGMPHTDYSFMI